MKVVTPQSTDRSGGTSNQGHQGAARFLRRRRLVIDDRRLADVAKRLGRKLTAGVTIDAARVDEEIARNILGQALLDIGHAN